MANDREIVYIRGKGYWVKVLGDPVLNYGKDGKEWVFDLALDDDGVKQIKAIGLADRIKDKDDERGKFISFRQRVREGEDALPLDRQRIKVMDAAGKAWDQETKIGNGSVMDVKFEKRDYGKGKPKGVYPRAIRVLDHVAFESSEFAPLSKDDEFFGKAQEAEKNFKMSPEEDRQFKETFLQHTADDDMDDEVPF